MEHALFGVDLNPNSVRICRAAPSGLSCSSTPTYAPRRPALPRPSKPCLNLDLNVRAAGNSLVSRHALGAPLGQVFRTAGITVERYKSLVHEYFGANGQAAAQQLDGALAELKASIGLPRISQADPFVKKVRDAEAPVLLLENSRTDLFGQARRRGATPWSCAAAPIVNQRRRKLAEHQQGVFFSRRSVKFRADPEVLDGDARFEASTWCSAAALHPPGGLCRQQARSSKSASPRSTARPTSTCTSWSWASTCWPPAASCPSSPPTSGSAPAAGPAAPLAASTHELVEFIDFGDLYVFPQAKAYPAILTVHRRAPTATSSFRAALIPQLPPPALELQVATHVRTVAQSNWPTPAGRWPTTTTTRCWPTAKSGGPATGRIREQEYLLRH
ncbi:MAG: hypothetical protein WKG07_15860 [Hymenobacter sp.]